MGLITFLNTLLDAVSGNILGLITFLITFLKSVSEIILGLITLIIIFLEAVSVMMGSVRIEPGSHFYTSLHSWRQRQ